MKYILLLVIVLMRFAGFAQKNTAAAIKRFEAEARAVTIIRDNWGIPHIYGKTDADAVFGLMYAECEDNFKGIEQNYLYQLGKLTEVDGDKSLYQDIQLQMIADTADAIKDYQTAQPGFRKLLDAFADGLNYYLYKHPEVKPAVFQYFEPWYALMFTDGSVSATVTGGLTLEDTRNLFGKGDEKLGAINKPAVDERETGSNGFAIAPSRSASGHALLYINPHVPFYFRSEVQMASDEGLNVYGAVTWGQFFVYQGFNRHCGWMHTSSNADVGDLYAEKVVKKDGHWFYEYNGALKPVNERKLVIKVKTGDHTEEKTITGYYTHHGPVLGSREGKWLALKANNRSYNALLESWLITKANTFAEYKKAMGLLSNGTNNTVYADDQGNIAFWYGNFMPKRDPKVDWTLPVDGTTPATEWQGLHTVDEIVHVYNPATGWIQNCNSTPYASSGKSSPDKNKYPAYMAPDGQNYRAVNAIKLLKDARQLTLDGLIAKGYDHYLAAFDVLLPALFKAYDTAPDSEKQPLAEPITVLKRWDKRSAINSVATTLAVEWGTLMMRSMPPAKTAEAAVYVTDRVDNMVNTLPQRIYTGNLKQAVIDLGKRYGTWKLPWGDINRYQRPADGITFSDSRPSLPVGQTSSLFGQLPSFVSRTMNTQKRYGYSGNSFIAAVEFGTRIKAKSIITGGESFNSTSKNYTDQAGMYIEGKFKDVWFYKKEVLKHAAKTYHPGM
ncbi:penicillin acylase family protein [Mucilaginibacter gotjawali]|uniref:Glutaryl-7-aminocephalosporanic-acid acylase n=2 Tax=Mucilaginibacter gotjawali TaxID=1550579 RepID=A0A110B0T8_9SPHI|nr:penicillin acylase family protein [Mucilaginibacter gotjawali]MBB3057802.1 acyl-homoserine lactone acylase PvdQ [Mucilaginibacter gotjawali]BAU52604.1 Glutaryl-7-aminocephalosporanic-acid acylase precursor [Mucilaginibacter gotjawali]